MQRILVIGNDSLMGAGIESLLLRERSFAVWGIVTESTPSLLLTIQQTRPHIIIIDRHAIAISVDRLWFMLPRSWDLNLVEINADTPYARIFTQKQIWITRLTRLTSAIDWLTNRNKSEFIFLLKEAASI